MIGKAQHRQQPGPIKKTFLPMQQVHWDLAAATTSSMEGYNYAMILVDKATRYLWVYGLKSKG